MSKSQVTSRLVPLSGFASLISVSPRELYRMIDAKEVPPPVRQGRRLFYILPDDLDAYLNKLRMQRK